MIREAAGHGRIPTAPAAMGGVKDEPGAGCAVMGSAIV